MSNQKNQQPVSAASARELDKFELFFISHSKKILLWSAVLVILVALGMGIYEYGKSVERKDLAVLASASTAEEIRSALARHPDGAAAFEARVRISRLLAAKKQYREAAAALGEAASCKGAEEYLKGRAKADQGAFLEQAGLPAEALNVYKSISSDLNLPPELRAEASYAAGRVAASLGKTEEARNLYRRAAVKNVTSRSAAYWSELAEKSLSRLPAAKKEPPAKSIKKALPAGK